MVKKVEDGARLLELGFQVWHSFIAVQIWASYASPYLNFLMCEIDSLCFEGQMS